MCHFPLWRKMCHSWPVDELDPRARRTRQQAVDAAWSLLRLEGVDAVTHARVAEHAGLGRRTLYRHWPDPQSLLADVLADGEVPHAPVTGELRTDLVAHLTALGAALYRGGLAYVVCALGERAEHDEQFARLRSQLTDAGCAPLEAVLRAAARDGTLPADLDVTAAVALLEGPVFHLGLVRRRAVPARLVHDVVDRFLTAPPTRTGRLVRAPAPPREGSAAGARPPRAKGRTT